MKRKNLNRFIFLALILSSFILIMGCGESKPETATAPSNQGKDVEPPAEPKVGDPEAPTPLLTDSEIPILPAEDMEKLSEDGKKAIEQGSPLGEEKDPVAELQKKRGD